MASRSLGMVLVIALIAASGSVIGAQEILIEAEDFDCAQQSIVPAHVSARENASGGMLAVVRDRATGAPTWLDYMIAVEGGLYELLVRAGGNNSRQAATVSVDGGPPVTVLDDPPDSLPLGRAMPEDYEERSRLLERSFREHLLGRLQLPAGTHRIRVQHAGMADRSNSFGFDWLKLTAVEDSEAEVIEVGDRPEPQWGARSPQRRDLELAVLTGYRFWGPDETPRCTVMLFNRELQTPVSGTLAVHLVGAGSNEPAARLSKCQVAKLDVGECITLAVTADDLQVPPGRSWFEARFEGPNVETLTHRAEANIADLRTPGWVKRARTAFVDFHVGDDLRERIESLQETIANGINVIINRGGNTLGDETISYPYTANDEQFDRYYQAAHEAGGCTMLYRSMITIHEHFYYEHRDFWGGRPPFYHCSWLSIYPDSRKWTRWQAADHQFLLRKVPLDGVFMDNACAGGWPEARSQEGEQAIADHMSAVRAGLKRANPIAALYPNYNTLSPMGLRICARGWDASMLEGHHPEPMVHSDGRGAWPLARFVEMARRVRAISGKPFWPLMYGPGRYSRLGIAACGAAGCNPAGRKDPVYLPFLDDIEEYLYADDVTDAPEGTVALVGEAGEDQDLAATAMMKVYEPADGGSGPAPRDWIIQVVNATERDGEPVPRDVELSLDLPCADMRRGAWLLRPEHDAHHVELIDPMPVTVDTWAVLIVAEALLPELQVSPTHIRPVPGEPLDLKLNLSSLSGQPASGWVSVAWPEGWSDGEAVPVSSDGQNTLTLRPPVDAEATNLEVVLRLTHQGRVCYVPFVARMRPRVEVKMIPDHFSVLAGKRTEEAGLHITNHTQRAVEAELTTVCPAEWSVDAEREDLSLGPSETVTVPCTVTWPRFHPESLYDLLDGDVQVRVRGEEVDQRTATTVRVHMPITWVIYSPLGTELNDQISTGAHWLKILAHLVHTAHGNPYHGSGQTIDDALVAIDRAIQRQQAGNQRVVLWLRAGEQTDQLARPEVARKLSRLMELGGGVILQEDIFRLSEANRALLDSEVCPIGAPYRTRDRAGGDWRLTSPDSPAVHKFAQNVLEGDAEWRIPEGSQPAGLRFGVKSWAEVVATNAEGDPTVVVSTDPRRPVAYIAGSLEGPYMVDRQGVGEYPNQMSHLLYFYAELARWLSVFGAGGV